MYKAVKQRKDFIIVFGNRVATDREIQMRNNFWTMAEAQEVCDRLNKEEMK